MEGMIDFLTSVAFHIGDTPVSNAELIGFVLGVANVYLLTQQNIINFPIGIAMVAMFFVVFIEYKLYADAWLQVYFIVVNFFGWWAWLKAGPNRTKLKVRDSNWWIIGLTAIGVVIATIILTPILREHHGSYPVWDAFSTSLSLGAQLLLSFKLIENWFMWIVADLIYIPLYFYKDLYFTTILYVIFLGLCVLGYREWRKAKREDEMDGEVALA
jgi:nicotinamide mononucleotide transporter